MKTQNTLRNFQLSIINFPLLLFLLATAPAWAGQVTVTVTVPDDVLTAARLAYARVPGVPADQARLDQVMSNFVTQNLENAAYAYLQRLGTELAERWRTAPEPQRATTRPAIQQALEAALAAFPSPLPPVGLDLGTGPGLDPPMTPEP